MAGRQHSRRQQPPSSDRLAPSTATVTQINFHWAALVSQQLLAARPICAAGNSLHPSITKPFFQRWPFHLDAFRSARLPSLSRILPPPACFSSALPGNRPVGRPFAAGSAHQGSTDKANSKQSTSTWHHHFTSGFAQAPPPLCFAAKSSQRLALSALALSIPSTGCQAAAILLQDRHWHLSHRHLWLPSALLAFFINIGSSHRPPTRRRRRWQQQSPILFFAAAATTKYFIAAAAPAANAVPPIGLSGTRLGPSGRLRPGRFSVCHFTTSSFTGTIRAPPALITAGPLSLLSTLFYSLSGWRHSTGRAGISLQTLWQSSAAWVVDTTTSAAPGSTALQLHQLLTLRHCSGNFHHRLLSSLTIHHRHSPLSHHLLTLPAAAQALRHSIALSESTITLHWTAGPPGYRSTGFQRQQAGAGGRALHRHSRTQAPARSACSRHHQHLSLYWHRRHRHQDFHSSFSLLSPTLSLAHWPAALPPALR